MCLDVGHYTAFAKVGDGWYYFDGEYFFSSVLARCMSLISQHKNFDVWTIIKCFCVFLDDIVSSCNENDVVTRGAYILMYKRREVDSKSRM